MKYVRVKEKLIRSQKAIKKAVKNIQEVLKGSASLSKVERFELSLMLTSLFSFDKDLDRLIEKRGLKK